MKEKAGKKQNLRGGTMLFYQGSVLPCTTSSGVELCILGEGIRTFTHRPGFSSLPMGLATGA